MEEQSYVGFAPMVHVSGCPLRLPDCEIRVAVRAELNSIARLVESLPSDMDKAAAGLRRIAEIVEPE